MKDFREYGMTKRELLKELSHLKDDDIITFGNGLPNGKFLTYYKLRLEDSSNPNSIIYNIEFNEQITKVISAD